MDKNASRRANIVIGLLIILFAAYKEFFHDGERPTGRWAVVFGPIYDSLGPHGANATLFLIGVAFVSFSILKGK